MHPRRLRAPLLALLCAVALAGCEQREGTNLEDPESLRPTGGTAVNDTVPYSPSRETRP